MPYIILAAIVAAFWRIQMTIQEFVADIKAKLQEQRDASAAEHEQVSTAVAALKKQVEDALNGQVPQELVDEVSEAFDATTGEIGNIFTPDA